DALLRETQRVGATLGAGQRVVALSPSDDGFRLTTSEGELHARAVVLATGGQSLPKTGSDGTGFLFARRLGHTIVPPTPGLVPLVVEEPVNGPALHRALAGVSQDVELTIWIDGSAAMRLAGALL